MSGIVFGDLVSKLSNFCKFDLHVEIIIFMSKLNGERSNRKNGEIQLFMTFNHRNYGNNIHNALPWFSKDFLSILIIIFGTFRFSTFSTEVTHVRA